MMNELYPGEKRDILEGFYLYRGKGEIFDLSDEPPKRERFAFGGETVNLAGCKITTRCTACGLRNTQLTALILGCRLHLEIQKTN